MGLAAWKQDCARSSLPTNCKIIASDACISIMRSRLGSRRTDPRPETESGKSSGCVRAPPYGAPPSA